MSLDPNLVILYVKSPLESARFYRNILGYAPMAIDAETFVMFSLKSGLRLGLWAKDGVHPIAAVGGGGSELCLQVNDPSQVEEYYERWQQSGVTMLQSPINMDFGYTFTAIDADQHRIRVFSIAPSKQHLNDRK